jgi:hypothetical protein
LEPNKCFAAGPGLENPVPGEPTKFAIQARDKDGKKITEGGANFIVNIKGPKGEEQLKLTDNMNGTYYVSYVPQNSGIYTINISVKDEGPIDGSPFTVNSNFIPDVTKCYVSGNGIDSNYQHIERIPASFMLYCKDKNGNNIQKGGDKIDVKVTSPNGIPSGLFQLFLQFFLK